MKILIVHYVVAQLNILENMLKQVGYLSIYKAKNVKEATEAIAIAKESDIGIVICEWDIPDKTGMDFFHILQSNEKLKTIPFLLSFKTKQKEDILQASEAGITALIMKPYKLDALKQKLFKFSSQISKQAATANSADDNLEELMNRIEGNLKGNNTSEI